MAFAKLYGPDDDQILVKLDTNEDGDPEVRFFAEPSGLGICSAAVSWEDSPEGWAVAESFFAELDEAEARKRAQPLYDMAAEFFNTGDPI